MIEIKPLASGSKGNAYQLTDGHSSLLLEAGINYREIQKGFDFKMSQVEGCLITHEHGDHSKAVKDVLKAGIDVYMSKGTKVALNLKHHRLHTVEAGEQFKIGDWYIKGFDVQHDVSEPLGFLIAKETGERILFATDTYYIKHRFQGLTHIMVECNYSLEILEENILDGKIPPVMKKRLLRSHFSLEHVKQFLLANDLSKVQEIWLLHLSDTNSDAELFKKEIQAITGKVVYIA